MFIRRNGKILFWFIKSGKILNRPNFKEFPGFILSIYDLCIFYGSLPYNFIEKKKNNNNDTQTTTAKILPVYLNK